MDAAGQISAIKVAHTRSGERVGGIEAFGAYEMEAPCNRSGTLMAIEWVEGVLHAFAETSVLRADSTAGEGRMANVIERQRALDLCEWTSLSTMAGRLTVQNLGGTPVTSWALKVLQKNVCNERTKMSRDSQLKTYMRLAQEEGRGFPPGEIDLVT